MIGIRQTEEYIRQEPRQVLSFMIIGGWNTVFSYISLALLYYLLAETIHYMIILGLATIINITNAYLCHKFFVFKTKGNYIKEYLKYYVIYAIPIGLGFLAFPFCIEVLKMNFYLAQGLFTVMTVFISYFGHKHVSFKDSRS